MMSENDAAKPTLSDQLAAARAALEEQKLTAYGTTGLFASFPPGGYEKCQSLAAEVTRLEAAQFDASDAEFPVFDEEV